MMIGEREFAWLEAQAEERLDHVDHLLLASSVPWLMPPAIGDLETLNERSADRSGWRGRFAEKLRAGDFEHWPAYLQVVRAARRDDRPHRGTIPTARPRSVCSRETFTTATPPAPELDGDSPAGATVHQLVCSPVHNYVPLFIKPVFTLGWTRPAAAVTRWWVRRRGSAVAADDVDRRLRSAVRNTIATVRGQRP